MAACRLRARIFLLLPLLSAGLGDVNVITPDYPVNGSLGHSVWLPVEIDPIPNDAEIIWKFTGSPETSIARYDTGTNTTKIFRSRFAGRVQMFVNFTLQINALERIDEGIYTVSVVTSRDDKKHLSLQVYEPISKPRVELVNTTIGQPCMVTLRCSVERGDRVLYSWSPVGYFDWDDSIQPVSRNMEQLEVSVGMSNSINYLCTAQNPVSEESTVFSKDKPCQHTQKDSNNLFKTRINIIPIIVKISIIIIFSIMIIIIIVLYHKSRQKSGHGNIEG
ncbi:SLAM family member 5-like [Scyliorhinus canicula]|uniref:SLAM family member 5-like n=1 Tax=Scyliorhinus canicula TaxID=7830 RepID=UPI0018F7CFEF|nr:SLAM family member 5-like [Scyliorhinus canicula]